jgi:hypothetical protein
MSAASSSAFTSMMMMAGGGGGSSRHHHQLAADGAVFSRRFSFDEENEEAELTWAALERLPTYDRIRKSVILHDPEKPRRLAETVDVNKLGIAHKQQFVDRVFRAVEDDHERFLLKLRKRMDKYEPVPLYIRTYASIRAYVSAYPRRIRTSAHASTADTHAHTSTDHSYHA